MVLNSCADNDIADLVNAKVSAISQTSRGNSQFPLYFSGDDIIELELCGHCKCKREEKSPQEHFCVDSSKLQLQFVQM